MLPAIDSRGAGVLSTNYRNNYRSVSVILEVSLRAQYYLNRFDKTPEEFDHFERFFSSKIQFMLDRCDNFLESLHVRKV